MKTQITIYRWLAILAVIAMIVPFLIPDGYVAFAGFVFALMGPVYYLNEKKSDRQWADTVNQ